MRATNNAEGWVIVILLGALAVSVNLISFGLGFVNLVSGEQAPPPPPTEQAPAVTARPDDRTGDLVALVAKARAQLERMRREEAELLAEVQRMRANAHAPALPASPAIREEESARRVAELKERIAELERQKRNLLQRIEDRKGVDANSLFPGRERARKPQWVECVAETAVLQPQGQQFTLADLKSGGAAFAKAITTGYVVFLVRPTGFQSFYEGRKIALQHNLAFGYEPVDAGWKLRF